MTAKPWKQCGARIRAAILSDGPRPRVCRFVLYAPKTGRYAVHAAKGGRPMRILGSGRGTQDQAARAGVQTSGIIGKPWLWQRKAVDKARASGV